MGVLTEDELKSHSKVRLCTPRRRPYLSSRRIDSGGGPSGGTRGVSVYGKGGDVGVGVGTHEDNG